MVVGAQGLYTRWPDLPFEERRRVVETIVERIVVGSGEVEINLFYAPPAPVRRHVVVTALILKAPVLMRPQCRVMHGAAARPFEAGGERPGE